MLHKKRLITASGCFMASLLAYLLIPSCIDERYDLEQGISPEMTLGGDSLSLPIGSTDTIRLGDFLDPEDVEMMKTMEDGGYGLSIHDSIDVEVPKIDQSMLVIDNQTFTESQTVNFGDISLENFKIPGISVQSNIGFSLDAISLGNFAVPSIGYNNPVEASMSGFTPTDLDMDDIGVSGGKADLFYGINLPSNPGGSVPVPIDDPDPVSFNSTSNIYYSIGVPNGVSGIDSVMLDRTPPAKFVVSIQLAGADGVLVGGQIIPDITINPSDLFVFDNPPAGGLIRFEEKDSLTPDNQFTKSKEWEILELDIEGDPNAEGNLDISKEIVYGGSMEMSGIYVQSDKIDEVSGLDLIVSVSVNDVVIKSMVFNIPDIEANLSGSTGFNITNSVPADIRKVNNVLFDDVRKKLSIRIKAEPGTFPPMISKTFTLKDLVIDFPDEFMFAPDDNLVGSTYTIDNVSFDPDEGKLIELYLNGFDLSGSSTVGGLNWNGNITFSGKVLFHGKINSARIPTTTENSPQINLIIASDLAFKSAEVVTNDKSIEMSAVDIPISFNINIAKEVKRLDTIKLAQNTMISLALDIPELPLDLAAKNIQIEFPDLFQFNPPLDSNKIKLDGTLNDTTITLELASLNINSELVNGELILDEHIKCGGGVTLRSGTVNSLEIENLTGDNLSMLASTDTLRISSTSIQLNTLSTNYTDSTNLDIEIDDLPKEIISLDSIILADGAYLQLAIDITNMPELSNPLVANLMLDFPDILRFKPDPDIDGSTLNISQAFEDGKLRKTIGLKGLYFDGKALGGKLTINEKVKFNVGVEVEDPYVNSEQLTSAPIGVNVEVKLAGIKFESVYGKVDPGIDPIKQSIPLEGLPEFMKDTAITIDISKPVIALQTECNLGIPIIIAMDLTPYDSKGSVLGEGTQTLELRLPKATSAEPITTGFWIAPDSAGMPQDYQWIEAHIQKLFKTIPDKIDFVVNASTDLTQQHYINLNTDYRMKVNYEVTVPLAFGKDLNIVMRDTITDLDASIGEMALTGNTLELFGTILNSIPLQLELELIPLDKDNDPIDVVPARQIINPGAHDGTATPSDLSIKLEDPNGLLKNLRGFALYFRASSNTTVAGTPIKPDNFVKADLKVRLYGGIKLGGKN